MSEDRREHDECPITVVGSHHQDDDAPFFLTAKSNDLVKERTRGYAIVGELSQDSLPPRADLLRHWLDVD